jgi:hypothetical protein
MKSQNLGVRVLNTLPNNISRHVRLIDINKKILNPCRDVALLRLSTSYVISQTTYHVNNFI